MRFEPLALLQIPNCFQSMKFWSIRLADFGEFQNIYLKIINARPMAQDFTPLASLRDVLLDVNRQMANGEEATNEQTLQVDFIFLVNK